MNGVAAENEVFSKGTKFIRNITQNRKLLPAIDLKEILRGSYNDSNALSKAVFVLDKKTNVLY